MIVVVLAITTIASVVKARRDPTAFAPLYEAYADLVWRYMLSRLGDPELKTAKVTEAASIVSAIPEVRAALLGAGVAVAVAPTAMRPPSTRVRAAGLEDPGAAAPAPGAPAVAHWSMPDPAASGDTDAASYPAFVEIADETTEHLAVMALDRFGHPLDKAGIEHPVFVADRRLRL